MTAAQLSHELAGPAGAPVLALGGSLGTTLAMWAPQVSRLSGRIRTVAFDHRGHGRSPVPAGPYEIADLGGDVLALLDRLGIERAAYCGLSLGGMVGQWLAINAPQRITKLILICTAAYLPPASAWIERAAGVRAAGSPEVVADTVVGRWFTPAFAAANPALVAGYREMIASTDGEGYASCCEAISTLDLRAGLPAVTAPTLVIAGAQDPSIPAEHGRAIAEAVPHARFEVLDPAAHLASVERAPYVTQLIEDHLEAT
jgi:3-oxoadipate enol-lactonase